MVATIRRPGRVVWVNLRCGVRGNKRMKMWCTRVGVRGQGARISIFLGRCPRCKVTRDGVADIVGGTALTWRFADWLETLLASACSFDIIPIQSFSFKRGMQKEGNYCVSFIYKWVIRRNQVTASSSRFYTEGQFVSQCDRRSFCQPRSANKRWAIQK